MFNCKCIIITAIILGISLGCTAITDFDEPTDKINLQEELGSELTVTLNGNLAQVQLTFESQLPSESADEIYDMIGSTITLQMINNENHLSSSLTNEPVDAPSGPGEYSVLVANDNINVDILFYNESTEGYMLRENGDYTALLVVQNNDYFTTGQFTFDVVVE